ncbi:hypothetical protein QOZ80_7AG0565300 [Eleusine coracana subsp. coracana]|nr:hypothetical protein QOZ80_7AG0565300 [Eleusine coracana subsp. coracana]
MAAVTATTRKRSSPDAASSSTAGDQKKKRARVITFGNIYDYEKLEVLGEGTYGVVLKARDRRTGRPWPSSDPRRAADAATGAAFLVMEFVGPSLQQAQGGRLFSEREARACMRQLLGGAARIHAAGLVHRDVKPDNVLVGPSGELKICDFGMAAPAKGSRAKPYAYWWAGTPGYRAPEQLAGNPSYGPAVDMWALGCVMAELLTGEVLFDTETEEDMLNMAMDMLGEFTELGISAFDTLEAFRGLPPEMSMAGREVLAGLLNFDAAERLTAADALKHRWFTEDLPDDDTTQTPPPPQSLSDDRPFFHFL